MKEEGAPPDLDSSNQVVLMENHDEAYQVWRASGLTDRILIHVDAHDDVCWSPDQDSTNIANFICPALKEGIVKEVFWVVPDQTWQTSKTLKPLRGRLKTVMKKYPGASPAIQVQAHQISTAVLGKPFRVCTLGNLPDLGEKVLLDIDVDYFIISRACRRDGLPEELPWCWPEDLVVRLPDWCRRAELVTIAYSVEGGYTPLKWKYLGDELALRLRPSSHKEASLKGMNLMRAASLAARRGDLISAAANCQEARGLLPTSAAPPYHLAHLYLEMGRFGQAQECYQQALALDPSYRTAYNSAGFQYYSHRRFNEAKKEHQRTLTLDPEDAHAHFGLGQLAVRSKRWQEAETWLKKALALNRHLIDAYRLLGEVLARQSRLDEAIQAYERSLTLALAGHKPLEGPIVSNPEGPRLLDPDHFHIHACLARLYDLKGESAKAINGYRLSIAKGCDGVLIRGRLARLYLKQRQWQRSGQEAWQGMKMIPKDLNKTGQRSLRRLARAIKEACQAVLSGKAK